MSPDAVLALAAVCTMLGGCAGALLARGRTEGRITVVLENLDAIVKDHEERIREQERRRR